MLADAPLPRVSLSAMSDAQQNKGQSEIILKKFDGKSYCFPQYATSDWKAANQDKLRTAVVVDTETTGTVVEVDQIIEIGLVLFTFNREDGAIVEVNESYSSLNDLRPDFDEPLSTFVTQLTGLTEADLKGQKIDWQQVDALLERASIVIAHNAKFDRAFIDKQSQTSREKIWGCSMGQVDWMSKGFRTQGLELLCCRHGFYTESHRALSDVESTVHLITSTDSNTSKPYLHELLGNARQHQYRLEARRSPFETKDLLKRRRYQWDANAKTWFKLLAKDELEAERNWLAEKIYTGEELSQATKLELHETYMS